jgi:hypothetical protein
MPSLFLAGQACFPGLRGFISGSREGTKPLFQDEGISLAGYFGQARVRVSSRAFFVI